MKNTNFFTVDEILIELKDMNVFTNINEITYKLDRTSEDRARFPMVFHFMKEHVNYICFTSRLVFLFMLNDSFLYKKDIHV